MKKNPWIAAITNFIIPGVGYLYLGKRTVFAALLVVGSLISGYWMFTDQEVMQTMTTPLANIIYVFWGIAFAIDAYNDAGGKLKK